ncbi:MAG: hypothetical protein DMF58_20290 [Acidobacteria bacterium]|nr:MAG: hypothetical protein DMF58_20290 [Acidobacteriota bacterium]
MRNFEITLDNGTVRVSPSSTPLPPNSRVEVLNTSTGNLQAIDDFGSGSSIAMQASVGDRILLLIAEKNTDASQPVSIVFNKPIFVSGDADAYLHSQNLLKVLTRQTGTGGDFSDITQQVRFEADSGNRRITVRFENPLQLP